MKKFINFCAKNKIVGICSAIAIILIFIAVFAPYITPQDPLRMSLKDRLLPPSIHHYFGTDEFGRDLFSRVILGTRVSIFVSLTAVGLAYIFGTIAGISAAWWGGWIDNIIMRIVDISLAFPYLLMAIIIISIFGQGLQNLIIAIALWITPNFTRVVRSCVLTLKEQDYIEAARAVGGGNFYIIWRHVLPNYSAPVMVFATLYISRAIILEAALSFLGLGIQPPTPSWGLIISTARSYIRVAPHIVLIAGIIITIAVLAFNIIGDGLRDALDPRLKNIEKA
jgi:peptide/nickel transport system permease protein